MNPHAKRTPFRKFSILVGIVLGLYLFFLQIPPALAMERLPWKINIPKRKLPKDTTPPVTRDSGIDGLWHNQPVTVILKAEDSLSGIDKTYYSLNGSTPGILYQRPIVVSKQGVYRLRYYSKDKAGNVERIKTAAKQIKIDTQAPKLTITAVPTPTNQDVRFVYSVSDNFTPVSQMQISGDNSPYSEEKTYTVDLIAKDLAGNSSKQTINFTIDKTPPIVQITSPQNNSVVNTPQITVQYNLTDGTSTAKKNKPISLISGANSIKIEEKDLAGNPGWDTISVILDNIAPSPPIGLSAAAGSTTINLAWNANIETDLAGYNIYRSQTPGGPYVKLNSGFVKQNSYTDNDAAGNRLYYYVLTSVDTYTNESAYSQEQNTYINATDETEPNNSLAVSNTIEINNSCTGLVYPDGDSDFYKFAISKPGGFTLTMSGIAGDQIGEVNFYGKTYYPITNSKSETNGKDVFFTVNLLEKCDYYLQVSFSLGKSSLTPYTLTLSLAEAFEDAHEINDSFETATLLSLSDSIQAGLFGNEIDVDTYKAILTNPGKLTSAVTQLPGEMTAVITVFDNGYKVIKSISSSGRGQPAILTTDNLPAGDYYIRVFEYYGKSFLEPYTLTTSFELQDTTPPRIEIKGITGDSFVNTDVTLVITISDEHLDSQSITLNGELFVSGTAITKEGQYTLEVTAEDKAANRITQTIKFTIDKTPPVIISSWPGKGSSVGTQGNPLTLNIVFGDALSGIEIGKVKLMDEKGMEITAQSELSQNNIQFVIQSPVDKEYKFSLYLEDKAGNTALEEISFTVDSTLPEISADVIGGTFSESVNVKLECSEDAMIYYSTDGYPPIEGNSNTMAVKGTYAELAAINKTTKLQFFAVDNAGNRSSVKAETYLFNELPAVVSGLQGFYNESQKRVELIWQQVSPVEGYYVYRALNIQEIDLLRDSNARKYPAATRLRISESLITSNLFYDSNVLSGTTYWYGVSVADTQGRESPVSELTFVEIPAQLPAADRKEAAKRALAWIEANQSAQGYWGEKKELRMLATSQALNALYTAYWNKPLNIWLQRGIFWLRGNFADNNDYLARKIMTLVKFGQNVDEESHRLFSQADMELPCSGGIDLYGWGVTKQHCRGDSYGNDAFCTVLGISAVKTIFKKYSPTENIYYCDFYYPIMRDKTLDSLLNYPCQFVIDPLDEWGSYMRYNRALRSKDGRYGWVPKRDTSIFVSSFVYSYVAGTNKSFYQWILDSQGANGSFGSGLIDTAGVLLWIPLDEAAKTKAINYLISQQCPDGSWNNGDAYLTGLCLEAIIPYGWNGDWEAAWN